MKVFRVHMQESNSLHRLCRQDNLIGNTTKRIDKVTCKKCLRSLVFKSRIDRANKAYVTLVKEDMKRAGIDLLGLDNK